MIKRGQVSSIRELSGDRIQARVCLGASVEHGSAIVQIETASAAVREALTNLRAVIGRETLALTANIIKDHEAWEAERDGLGEARALFRAGKKINAIREVRAIKGLDLKDAKELVESWGA